MKIIELSAEEFLSLYTSIMFTPDYAGVCDAIKKIYNVNEVYTHELPFFVETFKKSVTDKEILIALDAIGKFIPAEDNEDKTTEAQEYVQSFIKTYGSESIMLAQIDVSESIINGDISQINVCDK